LFGGAESSSDGRRHTVPSKPGMPALAELVLGAGGAPEYMAFQGRAESTLGRGLPRTAADAGKMLDGAALCCGLAKESDVNMARKHATYRDYVDEKFDGAGVHAYNDEHAQPHARWKRGGSWQKAPHALSANATATVRAPKCTGRVIVNLGSAFTVVCPDCTTFRRTLTRGFQRAAERKRKMDADPEFRAKCEAAPTDPSSRMRDCDRTVEQRLQKQAKISDRRLREALQAKDLEIAGLKKLLPLEKADAMVIPDQENCQSESSLAAEDMAALWKDPKLQAMAREQFTKGLHPVAAALWEDQHKFKKLDDARGMR